MQGGKLRDTAQGCRREMHRQGLPWCPPKATKVGQCASWEAAAVSRHGHGVGGPTLGELLLNLLYLQLPTLSSRWQQLSHFHIVDLGPRGIHKDSGSSWPSCKLEIFRRPCCVSTDIRSEIVIYSKHRCWTNRPSGLVFFAFWRGGG